MFMACHDVNPIIKDRRNRRISAALHAMSCLGEGSDSETFTDTPEELKEAIKRGDIEKPGAVLHEQLDVVKLLMQRSADPLARTTDECKLSPIDLAHVQNQQEILDSLCAEKPLMPIQRRFALKRCVSSCVSSCQAPMFFPNA
eukprot:s2631_g1.t1